MTPEQLADFILGGYLFTALGLFVVVLIVLWMCESVEQDYEARLDAEVDREIEAFGKAAVIRARWRVN